MGYTSKFFINNVSAKLPCRAFAILRESWEMIMNPDVGCLSDDSWQLWHIAQVTSGSKTVSNVTEIWVRWTFCDPSLKHRMLTWQKLIVWRIFDSRLLSSFSMSALYSSPKYLCYTTNRHRPTDKFEKYNSGLGFDRLGATYFQTLWEIATLVWVATHTMGTTGLKA